MLLQNKKVAIIGGGPGGLTLAKLLQLKGVNVKVYERDVDKDVRIQGGALDLHDESGLAALEKAGLMDAFKANYRPGAEKMIVVDNQAKIQHDEHLKETKYTFGDKNYRPEIDRGPLRDIFLNSLEPGTIIWDSQILSMDAIDKTWKLNFKNGTSVHADFVVIAEGSNTKLRRMVTNIKPIWAGVTLIEGSIKNSEKTAPRIHKLLKGGKIFAYGNEKVLIVSSKGDGSLGFATSIKTDENWIQNCGIDFKDNKQVLAWFKKEFSEWDSIWWELFESETTLFIPRPQYHFPFDQKWDAQSNITIIGDAAHWMPPFAGEGVNMAMQDALELSEALTNPEFTDLKTAVESFEEQMNKRFSIVGEATLFNTKWMHGPNALKNMLTMFSSNILKSGFFMGKMMMAVYIRPLFQKLLKLSPRQNFT